VLLVLGVGVVLFGISLIPAYLAGSALDKGRIAVVRGQNLLLSAKNPSLAVEAFAVAERAFDEAAGHASNPLIRLESFVPLLGRTPDAMSRLATTGTRIARAGSSLSVGAMQIPGGLASLAPRGGQIPIGIYQDLVPRLHYARSELEAGNRELLGIASSLLVPPVSDAVELVRTEMDDVLPLVRAADSILGALPQLAGANGTRRYLVAAQNPAELRGTGGIMGMHSIMTIRKGRIDLGPFVDRFPPDPPDGSVRPPPGFGPPYTGFDSPSNFLNSNAVPDAPTAAVMIERLWSMVEGEELDGVVFVSPQALESLLKALGPVQVSKLDYTVDAANVVEFTSNQAFFLFNKRQHLRNRALGLVAEAVLDEFFEQTRSTAGIEALAEAASLGYITVHAADPEVHRGFAEAGVDGTFSPDGRDFFSVIINNIARNKVDYYTERSIEYAVTLQAGGSATAEATLKLENTAPTQEGFNEALGPFPVHRQHPEGLQLASGENYSFVTVYCSATCDRSPGERDSGEILGGPYPQGDARIFLATPRLRSGESRTYGLGLRTSRAWTGDEVGGIYRLRLGGQATLKPTRARVTITLPPHMRLLSSSASLKEENGALVWEGDLGLVQDLELRFERPLLEKLWIRTWDFLSRPVVRIG
jgi:hypothetical protein